MKLAPLAIILATILFTSPVWADALSQANALGSEAIEAHRNGELKDAESLFHSALAAMPGGDMGSGARKVHASLLREFADLRLTQGRPDEARHLLAEAQGMAQGDAQEEAAVLNALGLINWQQGRLDDAEDSYGKAMSLYKAGGQAIDRAMVLGNMGLIALDHFTEGGPPSLLDQAERAFTEARDVFMKQGLAEDIANQWNNLGLVYRNQKKFAKAEKAHREALKIDEKTGNQLGMVDDFGNLGRVAEDSGNLRKAAALYRQAFDLARTIGYARGIAHHGLYLMSILNRQCRHTDARAYAPPTLEAAANMGRDFTLNQVMREMGRTAEATCSGAKAGN